MNETPSPVARLLSAAESVWQSYREQGPGKVTAELYDAVDAAISALKSEGTAVKIADFAETLRDLCYRCCCRSDGLCFVTGEAGLIPRRDLHEQFETALETLREVVETPE